MSERWMRGVHPGDEAMCLGHAASDLQWRRRVAERCGVRRPGVRVGGLLGHVHSGCDALFRQRRGDVRVDRHVEQPAIVRHDAVVCGRRLLGELPDSTELRPLRIGHEPVRLQLRQLLHEL